MNFKGAVIGPLPAGVVTIADTLEYVGSGRFWHCEEWSGPCVAHFAHESCCAMTTVWSSTTRKKTCGAPPDFSAQATSALAAVSRGECSALEKKRYALDLVRAARVVGDGLVDGVHPAGVAEVALTGSQKVGGN